MITPDEVTELTRQGDEAFGAGDADAARAAYQKALRLAGDLRRAGLLARLGFLKSGKGGQALGLLRVQQAIEALGRPPVFVGEGLAVWLKRNSFDRRADFLHYAEKHAALLPAANWHWNLQTVEWAIRQAESLPGDFVELGVFRGHTTIVMAELLGFAAWPRRWFLYDTFEGIPVDQLNEGWAETNKGLYGGTYSFEEVRDRFAAFPNIEVIKGRVPEILAERCPDRIAFLHMDLNSAVAEIAALDFVYDRLSPGGVIVFDDYCWNASAEQYRAERRWMSERGLHVLQMPTGQGVFVKPR